MSISDTQSYSVIIRDGLFASAVTMPFFQGFKARRCRQDPIQKEHLPYLGVYIVEETMTPDGDYDIGCIRFIHSVRIGFSVIVINNDPVASELKLDAAFWALMNGLWRDPKLTNFWLSSLPDNTTLRGIERGTRKHFFGAAGANNETPIAEMEYIPSVVYAAEYGPIITDDLLQINVQVVPVADDGTVPPADQVQRIITDYEFTPAKGASDGRSNE